MKTMMYVFIWTAMIWLSGCGSQQEQTGPMNISQASHKYHVEVRMDPAPAQPLQENNMYITLTDMKDQTVSQADVIVSLSMKNMNHGNLTVLATPAGDGVYLAKIVPVMGGEWIAEVKAQIQEHKVQTQYYFEAKR